MRVEGSKRQSYPQPAAPPPAASAVVVIAVVVELDPEARTGSRRSMMTDDSRPNHATWSAARCSKSPKCFCTGKSRPLQNDVLEIGSYRTRPARQDNESKIRVRGTASRLCARVGMSTRMSQHTKVGKRSAASSLDRDRRNRPHQRPGDGLDDLGDGYEDCERDRRAAGR